MCTTECRDPCWSLLWSFYLSLFYDNNIVSGIKSFRKHPSAMHIGSYVEILKASQEVTTQDFKDVYFVHPLTHVLVDISTDKRSICRSSAGQYVNCYNNRDMLVNISTKISAEWWLTYQSTIGRYLSWYTGWHSANTLTVDCWRNIGWLSLVYRSTVL